MSDHQRTLEMDLNSARITDETLYSTLKPGELCGKKLGRYKLGKLLGTGGGSHVYEAYDVTLERKVAIKILLGHARDWTRQALAEARAQASVDHEFICKVYDVGYHEGLSYIAMQFINGMPLDEAGTHMSLKEKVELMRRILLAVEAAHRRGLIHRDLKPPNILVVRGPGGFWKPYVTDFGLARELMEGKQISISGKIHGTPAYMAPEQAMGENVRDTRADIYSLGATFYELLVGQPPFSGRTPIAVMMKVVQEPPEKPRKLCPGLPAELETILLKALAKQPEQRFDSVGAIVRELTRYLQGEPVHCYPGDWRYIWGKRFHRHRLSFGVASFFIMVLALFSGLVVRDQMRTARHASLMERFLDEARGLEWRLRIEHMMPVHDSTPARKEARERLAWIEQEMEKLGDLARGPGHYALGRGYLELGQLDEALAHLELARDHGEDSRQVDHALGEALAETYSRMIQRLGPIEGNSNDETILKLRQDYLLPALDALKRGEGAAVKPEAFFRAQIAFYEGQHEHALSLAENAYAENPWYYEALELSGRVYLAQAQDAFRVGELERARGLFAEAGGMFERVFEVAHSDSDIYSLEVERRAWLIDLAMRRGEPFDAVLASLFKVSDTALTVSPSDPEQFAWRSYAHYKYGEYLWYYKDQDPRDELGKAIQEAQRAITTDPRHSFAYKYQGHAYSMLSEYLDSIGEDPLPSLEKARQAYEEGLKLLPENAPLLNNLGIVYWQFGEYGERLDGDAEAHLQRATELLELALRYSPRHYRAYNNLGLVYWTMAERALRQGKAAPPLLEKSRVQFRKAIKIGNYPHARSNLCEILLLQARHALNEGSEPDPYLDECQALLDVWRSENPNDPGVPVDQAQLNVLLAERLLARGQDPSELFARVEPLVAQMEHAGYPGRQVEARYHMLRIIHGLRLGKPSARMLKQARSLDAEMREREPGEARILAAMLDLVEATDRSQAHTIIREGFASDPLQAFQYQRPYRMLLISLGIDSE